jgi:hypothetical protein
MKSLCVEKNSCRYMVEKFKLMPDQCCQPCKDIVDFSLGYLSKYRELWIGVCHRLHYPTLIMNQDSEHVAPSKRCRVATDRYTAAPSNGRDMHSIRCTDTTGEVGDKKRKRYVLQAIQSSLQNREIDRAIASRYVAAATPAGDGADKENKKISFSLPNGGQSQAAVYKRKKLSGQVFNGMAKQIGGLKNADEFREEAITTSLKQQPFLLCGDSCPPQSSFEHAATTSLQDSADKATTSDETTTGGPPPLITRRKMRDRKQRLTKRQERLKLEIGTSLIADLQKMQKNEERRPILACYTTYTKEDLEQVSDTRQTRVINTFCYSSY